MSFGRNTTPRRAKGPRLRWLFALSVLSSFALTMGVAAALGQDDEELPGEPNVGKYTMVASGPSAEFGDWQLLVADSDQGPCFAVRAEGLGGPRPEWLPVEQSPVAGGCGPTELSTFNAGTLYGETETLVYGSGPRHMSAVQVTSQGATRTARLYSGPAASAAKFFAISIPAGSDASVVARDSRGGQVATAAIRGR